MSIFRDEDIPTGIPVDERTEEEEVSIQDAALAKYNAEHYPESVSPTSKETYWRDLPPVMPTEEPEKQGILDIPGNVIKGAALGTVAGIPKMVGEALEYAGAENVGGKLKNWGEEVYQKYATPEERETYSFQTGEFFGIPLMGAPFSIAKGVYTGAKMAQRAKRLAEIAEGTETLAGMGKKLSPLAKATPTTLTTAEKVIPKALEAGTHAVPGAVFFGSTAQGVEERAEEAGVDPGWAPEAEGLLMSAGLMLTNALLLKAFGKAFSTLPTDAEGKIMAKQAYRQAARGETVTEDTVKQLFKLQTAQDVLRDYVTKILPASTMSMFSTVAANAQIEKENGIRPDADPLLEGLESLIPLIGMHAIAGPMAALSAYVRGNRKLSSLKKAFDDMTKKAIDAKQARVDKFNEAEATKLYPTRKAIEFEGFKQIDTLENQLKDARGAETGEALMGDFTTPQLPGGGFGAQKLLPGPKTREQVIAEEGRAPLTFGPRAEETPEQLITDLLTQHIRESRVPKTEIKETGNTELRFFTDKAKTKPDNRMNAEKKSALVDKLKRLNDNRDGRTYVIEKRDDPESPYNGQYSIARVLPEMKRESVRAAGLQEEQIKSSAVDMAVNELIGSYPTKTQPELRALAIQLYNNAKTEADATSKTWEGELKKFEDLELPRKLVDATLDAMAEKKAGKKELDALVKMWRGKQAARSKYTMSNAAESTLRAMGVDSETLKIKDVEYADLLRMAQLNPELLRDYVKGTSAIETLNRYEEKKAREKEEKAAKRSSFFERIKTDEPAEGYVRFYFEGTVRGGEKLVSSNKEAVIKQAEGNQFNVRYVDINATELSEHSLHKNKDGDITLVIPRRLMDESKPLKRKGTKEEKTLEEQAAIAKHADELKKKGSKPKVEVKKEEPRPEPKFIKEPADTTKENWVATGDTVSKGKEQEAIAKLNKKHPVGSIHTNGEIIVARKYDKDGNVHVDTRKPIPTEDGWLMVPVKFKDKPEANRIRKTFLYERAQVGKDTEITNSIAQGKRVFVKIGEPTAENKAVDIAFGESTQPDPKGLKKVATGVGIGLEREDAIKVANKHYPKGSIYNSNGKDYIIYSRMADAKKGISVILQPLKGDKSGRMEVRVDFMDEAPTAKRKIAELQSFVQKFYKDAEKWLPRIDQDGRLTIQVKQVSSKKAAKTEVVATKEAIKKETKKEAPKKVEPKVEPKPEPKESPKVPTKKESDVIADEIASGLEVYKGNGRIVKVDGQNYRVKQIEMGIKDNKPFYGISIQDETGRVIYTIAGGVKNLVNNIVKAVRTHSKKGAKAELDAAIKLNAKKKGEDPNVPFGMTEMKRMVMKKHKGMTEEDALEFINEHKFGAYTTAKEFTIALNHVVLPKEGWQRSVRLTPLKEGATPDYALRNAAKFLLGYITPDGKVIRSNELTTEQKRNLDKRVNDIKQMIEDNPGLQDIALSTKQIMSKIRQMVDAMPDETPDTLDFKVSLQDIVNENLRVEGEPISRSDVGRIFDELDNIDPKDSMYTIAARQTAEVTGTHVLQQRPKSTIGEWKLRIRELAGNAWNKIKSYLSDVWKRLTERSTRTETEPLDKPELYSSESVLSGEELFRKFANSLDKKHKDIQDPYVKAIAKNFATRLTLRSDSLKERGDEMFEFAILHFNGDKDLQLTDKEVRRMRDYCDQVSVLYGKSIKERKEIHNLREQVAKTFYDSPKYRGKSKPTVWRMIKSEVDAIVWDMLSPFNYSKKLYEATKNGMESDASASRMLGGKWSIHSEYGRTGKYLLREVTPTVRTMLLDGQETGRVKGVYNGALGNKIRIYKNGLETIERFGKEYLYMNEEQAFHPDNKEVLSRVDLAEATSEYGVNVTPMNEQMFSHIASTFVNVGEAEPKPKLDKAYIKSRIPDAKVTEIDANTHKIVLPNGIDFILKQGKAPEINVEHEFKDIRGLDVGKDEKVRAVGRWTIDEFGKKTMFIASDIERNVAIEKFDHEIFHMMSDSVLTRREQNELRDLYKQDGDKYDRQAWERAAIDYEKNAAIRRANPIMSKITDALLTAWNYVRKLWVPANELKSMQFRDKLFADMTSGKAFDRKAYDIQIPFKDELLRPTLDNGKKVDVNLERKNQLLDQYQGRYADSMFSLLRETTKRDSEHNFFHDPGFIQKIKDWMLSREGRKAYHKSGEEVGWLEHWLSNPAMLAMAKARDAKGELVDKYKHWRDTVDVSMEWESKKAEAMYNYRTKQTPTLQKLQPSETRLYDSLAEYSTMYKKYLTLDDFKNKAKMDAIFKELDPELKNATVTDKIRDAYLEQAKNMKENALPLLQSVQEASMLKPYRLKGAMTGTQYATLSELYKKLMKKKPEEAATIRALKKTDPVVYNAYKDLATNLSELHKRRNEMGTGLEGFFPVRRNQGDYYVNIYRVSKNPKYDATNPKSKPEIWTVVHTSHADNAGMNLRIERELNKRIKSDPLFKSTPGVEYKTRGGRSERLEDASYFMVGDLNTERIIDVALGHLAASGKNGITPEDAAALSKRIFKVMADQMRSRGSMQTAIQRTFLKWEGSPLISGYIRKGQREVQNKYMAGLFGLSNKLDAAQKYMQIIGALPADMAKSYTQLSDYVAHELRNPDKYDFMVNKAKKLAFNMYLLGKMSFSVMQVTQNFITGMPQLAVDMKLLGYKKGIAGAEKLYIKAMNDVFGVSMGMKSIKSRLTPEETMFLEKIHRQGLTLPQTAMEFGIEASATGMKGFRRAQQILTWPVAATETFNRKAAALAMLRMLKGAEKEGKIKNLTDEELNARITDFINKTHYWMGKGNDPAIARLSGGAGKLGSLGYTFGRFWHNYAANLVMAYKNYGGIIGTQMAARSLAMLALIGGAPALPFIDELLDLLERTTGKPYRSDARRKMKSLFGKGGLRAYDSGILGYVFGDMSSAIRPLRVPFQNNASESLLGVYYGLGAKVGKSVQAMSRGDLESTLAHLSPAFIENLLKAHMGYARGLRNQKGAPLFDEQGNRMKYTPREALLAGFGFKAYRPSQVQEEKRVMSNVIDAWRSKAEELKIRARLAETSGDTLKIANAYTKYNMSIPKELQDVIPRIKMHEDVAPKRWVKFMNR